MGNPAYIGMVLLKNDTKGRTACQNMRREEVFERMAGLAVHSCPVLGAAPINRNMSSGPQDHPAILAGKWSCYVRNPRTHQ